MDQITRDIRSANWLNIINCCQNRPAGMTAKQWMANNGISEKSYYYWHRKFRIQAAAEMQLPSIVSDQTSDISFAELHVSEKTAVSESDINHPIELRPAAVIKYKDLAIALSNDISKDLLSAIIQEVTNA